MSPDYDPFAPPQPPELRVPLTLRLPPALHQQLAELAQANRRSLNAQILAMIDAAMPKGKTK